ncbi:uncharacterized protein [Clinocottus analis]|uniref:uncharacterized protein n=1 Tax=Clinocottus analis TaxID=304258 RepID=UPI0035BFD3E4
MKAVALLLLALLALLLALLSPATALDFYGDSVTFMPPLKQKDGSFKVTFRRRQNGRSSCKDQSSLSCEDASCSGLSEDAVQQTDRDATGKNRWCQSERSATVSSSNTSFSLRDSGCCWSSNMEGRTNWTSSAELDLGRRSDSHAINGCPVTATVSSLRVPQNCFSKLSLLAHDPDGDLVRCRFASAASAPANFVLDKNKCELTASGKVAVGGHVFELLLEDFPRKNITLTYADGTTARREASDTSATPLCKVKLQFSLEIVVSIPNCEAGHALPVFLSQTPSDGDLLYASVGKSFQLSAHAQARHTSVHDFQVSGPGKMTKEFTKSREGKASATLSWTPDLKDLYRAVPVCFTAESNETQSDMRCVVVIVTQASLLQGKASVKCSPNKMSVVLEKASMPGIDENFLHLTDSSCSLSSNGTHIMGETSFSACGTKLVDNGDFLVFKNEINSFVLPSEVIVRRKKVRVDISCQFPKSISISNYFNLHKSDYVFTESSFGSFGYTFEIFTNSNFTTKVAPMAYPVEVKLMDMIYMGIQAQSTLEKVTLFVESCKATPDDNPNNTNSYDILKNGCKQDETFKVYKSDQNTFNFEVQAFKFTGNLDQVYITCTLILCEPESSFSRCSQGCLSDPSRRRRKRSLNKETVGHSVTQGPFRFVRQADSNAAVADNVPLMKNSVPLAAVNPIYPNVKVSERGWGIKEILNTNISTVVFACTFFVLLALLVVVVGFFIMKRKDEDRRSLLVSGCEN